ncbi:hypothetical protein EDB87DRAFT_1640439 [Lactarius vividus]|nr:hypothetical protein EDB87DRAFT_1646366 [Lactarius vividus]KAH9055480.1 hypothetical protein EDB87DRAFT_1640439 [Lactarius vividus]
MQSGARVSDDLMCRGRFLRREWKRYKPHLAKSTSLPELDLVPANRPLFTCERCGFSNVYIPLCLWCTWTSPDATSAFKAATPRRSRRISSPSNALRKPDACSLRREDRQIQAPPMTLSGPKASFRPPVTTDALDNPAKPAPAGVQQSDQNGVVNATGGALRSSNADHPRKSSALRIRRGLPAATVVVPTRYPIMTTTIVSSGTPHTAPVSGGVKHAPHPFSLPPLLTPPTRTLRRKHHMTFPGEKSKRSLRSRVLDVPPPLPTPVSPVRLGHPSRPYYTAIRPHFNNGVTVSRPDTPTTPSSAPSPVTPAEKGQSLSSSPQGRPSFEFTRPRRSTTSGWSLSGEIELRIALSQRREEEEGGSEKRGSIARGVRKLGAGLRNLVLRRG